jgi:hypothetical protein
VLQAEDGQTWEDWDFSMDEGEFCEMIVRMAIALRSPLEFSQGLYIRAFTHFGDWARLEMCNVQFSQNPRPRK